MVFTVMGRALDVLRKKPIRLWGISLLNGLLGVVVGLAFGVIPGLSFCIVLLLEVGMTLIFLHGYRGEEVKAVSLFDCFKDWATAKRVLGGVLWAALWIFLWGLIPVVGIIFAIIRVYRYRLVPYILVMEPEVSATQAIKISQERTTGYKGKMFWADVLTEVIPWVVIAIFSAMARLDYVGWLFGLLAVVCAIIYFLFVSLYQGLVQAAFYEEITYPTMNTQGEETIACPGCGTRISAKAAFCPTCGASVKVSTAPVADEELETCTACGARVSKGASFCPNCGKAMTPAPAPAAAEEAAPAEESAPEADDTKAE